MSGLAHLYEPGMTYLLTTITQRREPIFSNAALAQAAQIEFQIIL